MKCNCHIKASMVMIMLCLTTAQAQNTAGTRDLNELIMSWSRSPRPALEKEAVAPAQVSRHAPTPVQPAVAQQSPVAAEPSAKLPARQPASPVTPALPASAADPMAMPATTAPIQATSNTNAIDTSSMHAQTASTPTPQRWVVSLRDKTLHRALMRWASDARYQLLWQTDRDFPIESEVEFSGDFQTAIGEVMSAVSQTDHPLQAIFNSSTRVMRVVRFMDERSLSR